MRRFYSGCYVLLAVFFSLLVGILAVRGAWVWDFWVYAGTARAISLAPFNMDNVFVADGAPGRGWFAYLAPIALVARLLAIDPVVVMAFSGVVNVVLLFVSISYFYRCFGSPEGSCLFGLMALIYLEWAEPLFFSGEINATTILRTAPYPAYCCYALCLFAWGYSWKYRSNGSWGFGVIISAVSLFAGLAHPLCLIALYAGLSAIGLRSSWRARAILLSAAILTVFVACIWPPFPLLKIATGEWSAGPGAAVYAQGAEGRIVAAFLLLFAVWMSREPLGWVAKSAFLSLIPFYLYGFAFSAWNFCRVLAIGEVILKLAAGSMIARAMTFRPWVKVVTTGCLILSIVLDQSNRVTRMTSGGTWGEARLELTKLLASVPLGATVLADLAVGRVLPSMGLKTVGIGYPEFYPPAGGERDQAVIDFFNLETSKERRLGILRRYRVEWILMSPEFADLITASCCVSFVGVESKLFRLARVCDPVVTAPLEGRSARSFIEDVREP